MALKNNFIIAVGFLLWILLVPDFTESNESTSGPVLTPDINSTQLEILPAESTGLTLQECYRLALKRSETVAIQKEIIKEAEGRFWRSLSGALPKVAYEINETRQDGSGATNFTLSRIPERKFTLSQPLFSGFKEFAAIAASRAERRQRTQEYIRAQQLLFIDVSDAFYFLLSYQKDLEAVDNQKQALLERVDELRKREELGRSRISEVATARARLSRLEAEIELTKSQAQVGFQLLEFLTGTKVDSLKEDSTAASFSQNKEDYLKKVDQRPDVIAAKEALEVSRKEVVIARAGFFPEVSLDGNYYDERVGNAADVRWDVLFSVKVPIFQGGENVGKVKEARSLAKQQDLQLSSVRRSALLEIENNFTRWQAAVRRVAALQKAFKDSQESYNFQKEDYSHNLVNNLDVLQALEEMEDVHRDLISIQNESQRLYSDLLVSTGEILQ